MYQLIIADDERLECRGLEKKIRELVPQLTLLPSVNDGAQLLRSVEQYHPDIAIVDINMPGLSGLKTIEILRRKKINLKIIINTAYSEFEYLQKALQLGASDYLLKPGNKYVLAEALQRVCRQLDEERPARQEQEKERQMMDSLYALTKEKWLLSLLMGQQDEKGYAFLCGQYPQLKNGGRFTVWRLLLKEEEQQETEHPEETLQAVLGYMEQACSCMGIVSGECLYLFLIKETKEETTQEERWEELLEYGIRQAKNQGMSVRVGVSREKTEPEQYPLGFYEAQTALLGYTRPGIVLFCDSRKDRRSFGLSEKLKEGARLLAGGELEAYETQTKEALEKEISLLTEERGTLEYFKVQMLLYRIELEEELRLYTDPSVFRAGSILNWSGFRDSADREKLRKWLKEEVCLCRKRLFEPQSENTYIEKAMRCIYENYGRDLSMDEVAGLLNITPFYLSRLLKQEKKATFVELLTDLRIRRAILLLKENSVSLREISRSTGYSGLPYFYRVFKKTTGFTAGVLREYL